MRRVTCFRLVTQALVLGCLVMGLHWMPFVLADDLPQADESAPILRGTVLKSKSLPPAMYGTWNIRATVIDSTAPPWAFLPKTTEIWTLEQDGDVITLKNVSTGASATIQVDNVQGNTVTFHRVADDTENHIRIIETPTITVFGNYLNGINRQDIALYREGRLFASYHLDIHVEGNRLSGPKVQFHGEDDTPPSFEVAPLQHGK